MRINEQYLADMDLGLQELMNNGNLMRCRIPCSLG